MTSSHGSSPSATQLHMVNPYRHTTYVARKMAPKNSVLGILQRSKYYKIFTNLIYKSGFDKILSDPEQKLTVFVISDKNLLNVNNKVNFNQYTERDFIGFHIVKTLLPYSYIMGNSGYVETYNQMNNLKINGLGLSAKIGPTFQSPSLMTNFSKQSSISENGANIKAGKSIIHVLNLPLIPTSW